MISLKLARKLKDAGLKPECADFELFWLAEVEEIMHVGPGYEPEPGDVWLPRLDQLLAEIERRGYGWELAFSGRTYSYLVVDLARKKGYRRKASGMEFTAPEEAAGEALLWILEREKEAKQDV